MPNQDWSINTKPAAAGDVYGLAFTNSQRLTFETEVAMTAYGVGVQQGAQSNTCKPGNAGGELLGITMRQNIVESATRPGDGTVQILPNSPLAVMMDGPIQVLLQTAITDENVGVDANGLFGGIAGDFVQCTNIRALKYPAAAGDVIPVMVVMKAPK